MTGLLKSAPTSLMLQNHLQQPEMKSISNPMRNGFEASLRRQINCGIQSKDEAFGSTIKTLAVQQQTTHDVLQADAHRSLPCPPREKGMTSGSLEERQRPLAPLGMPSVLRAELHPSFLRLAKHHQTRRQKVESSQFIMYKQPNPIKNALKKCE